MEYNHRCGPWGRKILLGIIAVFVSGIAVSCSDQFSSTPNSSDPGILAKPPDVTSGSKLVYSFNLIGYPAGKEYTGGCGNGRRIFVNRDARHAHILLTDTDDGWWIEDCNATSDNQAILHTDGANVYELYVRILGKPGGKLFVCADTKEDHDSGDHFCLLGTIDLTRGKGRSKFKVQPSSLFDAELEDIIWSIETNKDYRIAQFRVYKIQ